MKTVTLPGTETRTTVLGFGCSALLAPSTRAEGLALLETAYDAGIRHFDVARSYGYGDAEGLVGEFLGRHWGDGGLTVTTKFGLQPMKSVAKARALVGAARRLMQLSPFLDRAIRARARQLFKWGAFGVDEARQSLETSLRELKTERIDVYLMHVPRPDDCRSPELLEFLRQAVRDGKVGRFGVGTDIESVVEVCRSHPEFADVVQFQNSVLSRNIDRVEPRRDRATITHGALSWSYTRLREKLSDDPEAARRWSRELDLDCTDPAVLSSLMLNAAVRANPNGVVIFSSTRPESIRANVRAVAESPPAPDQLDRFAALAWEFAERPGS